MPRQRENLSSEQREEELEAEREAVEAWRAMQAASRQAQNDPQLAEPPNDHTCGVHDNRD